MFKSTALKNGYSNLYFLNTGHANIGDATGLRPSTVAGSMYLGLHTADPGVGGTQATNEITYTGYTRVAVPRSGAGFSQAGGVVSLVGNADFPQATAGSFPILAAFWSLGSGSTGATELEYSGPLSPSGALFLPFTALASDTLTMPGHTFAVSDMATFTAPPGTSLPAGMVDGTVYFIKTVTGNDFTLSATLGGATLDITAAGGGLGIEVSPITINLNTIPRLAAGTILREG